jgi:hypothetical protein
MAGIRLGSWESARAFKGIICDDISEFESSHASQAVQSLSDISGLRNCARPCNEPDNHLGETIDVSDSIRCYPRPCHSPLVRFSSPALAEVEATAIAAGSLGSGYMLGIAVQPEKVNEVDAEPSSS